MKKRIVIIGCAVLLIIAAIIYSVEYKVDSNIIVKCGAYSIIRQNDNCYFVLKPGYNNERGDAGITFKSLDQMYLTIMSGNLSRDDLSDIYAASQGKTDDEGRVLMQFDIENLYEPTLPVGYPLDSVSLSVWASGPFSYSFGGRINEYTHYNSRLVDESKLNDFKSNGCLPFDGEIVVSQPSGGLMCWTFNNPAIYQFPSNAGIGQKRVYSIQQGEKACYVVESNFPNGITEISMYTQEKDAVFYTSLREDDPSFQFSEAELAAFGIKPYDPPSDVLVFVLRYAGFAVFLGLILVFALIFLKRKSTAESVPNMSQTIE